MQQVSEPGMIQVHVFKLHSMALTPRLNLNQQHLLTIPAPWQTWGTNSCSCSQQPVFQLRSHIAGWEGAKEDGVGVIGWDTQF